jgi:hypothetical protein
MNNVRIQCKLDDQINEQYEIVIEDPQAEQQVVFQVKNKQRALLLKEALEEDCLDFYVISFATVKMMNLPSALAQASEVEKKN